MKLFLLSQSETRGYDTYDSAVVAEESAEAAKLWCPSGDKNDWRGDTWADSPEKVTAQEIGEAHSSLKAGVICASFNAG